MISGPNIFGGCAVLFWIPRQGSVARNNVFKENISNSAGCLIVQTPETDPNPKTVLIENNYFLDNTAKQGAAIWAEVNTIILQNNVFSGNTATENGGAVYCKNSQPISTEHKIIIINNSFSGNKAFRGGALYTGNYRVKPLIINSVFWGDTAITYGDEIYLSNATDPVEIAYSNIDTALIDGHFSNGGGIINVDPLFTDLFNLTPLHTSPIVDAGTVSYSCECGLIQNCPQYDILGLPRPWGTSLVDMGAYEYTDFKGIHSVNVAKTVIFPNPFTNTVTISYTLENSGLVEMHVFDNYGRLVAEPVNEFQQNGEHKVVWNSDNSPAGIYYFRLEVENQSCTGKMILIR